jgi:hypothetical protein
VGTRVLGYATALAVVVLNMVTGVFTSPGLQVAEIHSAWGLSSLWGLGA